MILDDEIPLSRNEVPDYVTKKYGKSAAPQKSTLAKYAVFGGGPEFCRYGRRVAYFPSEIDKWVKSRYSGPMTSTSDTGGANDLA